MTAIIVRYTNSPAEVKHAFAKFLWLVQEGRLSVAMAELQNEFGDDAVWWNGANLPDLKIQEAVANWIYRHASQKYLGEEYRADCEGRIVPQTRTNEIWAVIAPNGEEVYIEPGTGAKLSLALQEKILVFLATKRQKRYD